MRLTFIPMVVFETSRLYGSYSAVEMFQKAFSGLNFMLTWVEECHVTRDLKQIKDRPIGSEIEVLVYTVFDPREFLNPVLVSGLRKLVPNLGSSFCLAVWEIDDVSSWRI
mgnify:CR=1 FL=1